MSFGRIEELVNSSPVCSNGVIFLPYLNGGHMHLGQTARELPVRTVKRPAIHTWYEKHRQLYWSAKDQYRRIQNLLERGK